MHQTPNSRVSSSSHNSYKERVLELSEKLKSLTAQMESDLTNADQTKDK